MLSPLSQQHSQNFKSLSQFVQKLRGGDGEGWRYENFGSPYMYVKYFFPRIFCVTEDYSASLQGSISTIKTLNFAQVS